MQRVWLLLGMIGICSPSYAGKEVPPDPLENPREIWQNANWECWRIWALYNVSDLTATLEVRKKFIVQSLKIVLSSIEQLEKNQEVYDDNTVQKKEIEEIKKNSAQYLHLMKDTDS